MERESAETLLGQMRDEKSTTDHRFVEIQTNLRNEVQQNALLTSNKKSLVEQLRQAEDLALLVAADNDNMQQRLVVLQRECESLHLDKVALAETMEKSISEKDKKIRSLQRLIGAIQYLFDEDPLTDQSSAIRSLQRRIGALKDEYEQQSDEINKKDETTLGLQHQNTQLEQDVYNQEWTYRLL
ncbi:MAG: hypothetical protein U5N55_06055 [Cypionkella sp.]|nr:hypothetical protein [Cypionkella sp.]